MAIEISYRGEDRIVEFQILDSNDNPVDWSEIAGLILFFYYEKDHILAKFSKIVKTGFTTITKITSPSLGKFEVYLEDYITAKPSPSRVLHWEIKATLADADSPDGYVNTIVNGDLTRLEEAITRNISTL